LISGAKIWTLNHINITYFSISFSHFTDNAYLIVHTSVLKGSGNIKLCFTLS
jgi:hypothetical protein